MTIRKLASLIAKREGKKSQTAIGNIRETLGVLSDIIHEDNERDDGVDTITVLIDSGKKRAKRKKK